MRKQTSKKLVLLLVLAFAGWFFVGVKSAEAANPNLINFQGKVVNADGTNVTNGNYDFDFILYDDPTGGTNRWQEGWTSGTSQVTVTNGIFQVNLGTHVALPNFNTYSALYLAVKFNNDAQGYMTPRVRLTSVPYALNAEMLGGLDTTDIVHLAQGVQIDTSTTNPSIFINKDNASGTPNILQLQKDGTDVLVVDNNGGLSLAPQSTADIALSLDDDSTLSLTGSVTNSGTLQDINLTLGNDTGADTVVALNIDVTSVDTGADSDVLRAIDIANLSGGNANVTEQAIRIGTGWDIGVLVESGGLRIDSGEFLLTGGSRHTRRVTLVPEYPGATLTGDGSGNSGTMTSDFCGNDGGGSFADINTSVCGSGDFHNYYTWTHTSAGDYDAWVRYQIPTDFDGFSSSTSIQMFGWRTDSTSTTEVQLSLWEGGTQCGSTTNVATGTATWTETAMSGDETGCSGIADGDVIFFKVHMEVAANKTVRAGEIRFDYLSKW